MRFAAGFDSTADARRFRFGLADTRCLGGRELQTHQLGRHGFGGHYEPVDTSVYRPASRGFGIPPTVAAASARKHSSGGGAEASSTSRAAHALLFVLGALVTVAATVKVVAEKLAAEPAAMAGGGARAAGRALVEP